MILIIAGPGDTSALWLRRRLGLRLRDELTVITPAQLVYASSIAHRLSTDRQSARIGLAAGGRIDLDQASGIINRVQDLPTAHLDGSSAEERAYAETELRAFMLGMLASLSCPVLNRPTPEALWGRNHGWIQALQLAALAGLRCPDVKCTAERTSASDAVPGAPVRLFVVDGQLLGPLVPAPLRDSVIQFAASWGARLLQVDLDPDHSFRSATSFVDFSSGGDLLVRSIARLFER
jgi:hypothetical protein